MSLILPKYRVLFVHIPRTGGTTMGKSLGAAKIRCRRVRVPKGQARKHCPTELMQGRFDRAFAFVRHPIAWYESVYRYQEQYNWPRWRRFAWHPFQEVFDNRAPTFAGFIDNILKSPVGLATRIFQLYIDHPCVKAVGRTEHIQADLNRILSEFGVSENVAINGQLNQSSPSRCKWARGQRDTIGQIDKQIIDRFYS